MEVVPPNQSALTEALALSADILRNLELSEISLSTIALKTARLARLLNDFSLQVIMGYEVSGYPRTISGIHNDIWNLGQIAGRVYEELNKTSNKSEKKMYLSGIEELEDLLRVYDKSLDAVQEPNTTSTEGWAYRLAQDRSLERRVMREQISDVSRKLAERRKFIYEYVLQKHYELKFSGIADDIFARVRLSVDQRVGNLVPDAVKKFTAIYENLQSENPEDWSNAVHGCRRILQSLADTIFPPTADRAVAGSTRVIKLGKENYINRLVTFVEDHSPSQRFREIVGSHLYYMGNRLDSIYEAANKGSHDTIVYREEADRYVVFTYLLIGDILSLIETKS